MIELEVVSPSDAWQVAMERTKHIQEIVLNADFIVRARTPHQAAHERRSKLGVVERRRVAVNVLRASRTRRLEAEPFTELVRDGQRTIVQQEAGWAEVAARPIQRCQRRVRIELKARVRKAVADADVGRATERFANVTID